MPQTTASHTCAVASCILAQPLTVDELPDLHARYATPEYRHDIVDGHSPCEALARSVARFPLAFTERQLEGWACRYCGDEPDEMFPDGFGDRGQLFACEDHAA